MGPPDEATGMHSTLCKGGLTGWDLAVCLQESFCLHLIYKDLTEVWLRFPQETVSGHSSGMTRFEKLMEFRKIWMPERLYEKFQLRRGKDLRPAISWGYV